VYLGAPYAFINKVFLLIKKKKIRGLNTATSFSSPPTNFYREACDATNLFYTMESISEIKGKNAKSGPVVYLIYN
jgi:hypothetical protein